jgi:hypothetical protein
MAIPARGSLLARRTMGSGVIRFLTSITPLLSPWEGREWGIEVGYADLNPLSLSSSLQKRWADRVNRIVTFPDYTSARWRVQEEKRTV